MIPPNIKEAALASPLHLPARFALDCAVLSPNVKLQRNISHRHSHCLWLNAAGPRESFEGWTYFPWPPPFYITNRSQPNPGPRGICYKTPSGFNRTGIWSEGSNKQCANPTPSEDEVRGLNLGKTYGASWGKPISFHDFTCLEVNGARSVYSRWGPGPKDFG